MERMELGFSGLGTAHISTVHTAEDIKMPTFDRNVSKMLEYWIGVTQEVLQRQEDFCSQRDDTL